VILFMKKKREFKDILKMRIITYAVTLIIGVILIIMGVYQSDEVLSSFGTTLVLISAIMCIRIISIMFNKEFMDKMKISETDERNLFISEKSANLAFKIYGLTGAVCIIVLYATGKPETANIIAYSVCFLMILKILCYEILKRRY